MDEDKIAGVLAQMGRPRRVVRPHLRFDGDYAEASPGRVAWTREGAGLPVLFVHGWDGSPRDFSTLIPLAVQAGGESIALDLPGHGFSDGETLTPEAGAAAILAVAEAANRGRAFAAVIAHSFGCVATTLALEQGLKAHALVYFAPPVRQIDQFRRHAPKFGLSPEEVEEVLRRLQETRPSMRSMDLAEKARGRSEPLLLICSDDDEMTPLSGSREVAAAWPGARLLEAEGLGHNMTLRDRALAEAAIRFALG